MITGFFLSIVLTILQYFVSWLPDVSFPSQIVSGIVLFWSYVNLFSMLIPVSTILSVLLLSFTYLAVRLGWDAFHWLLRRRRS